MEKLIMGQGEAETIRELDRQVRIFLAKEDYCPLCFDESSVVDLNPNPDCPLCKGSEIVTGQMIEDYAIEHGNRSVLPSWYPQYCLRSSMGKGHES